MVYTKQSKEGLRRQIFILRIVLKEVEYTMDFYDPLKKVVKETMQRGYKPKGYYEKLKWLRRKQQARRF